MSAQILWRDAAGLEGSVDLTEGPHLIGRSPDCAIRTDDAMVSRNHARIVFEGGQYHIEDLGSANGIFLDERRVQKHMLRHGDAVRCGSLWLRFVNAAPTPSPKPTGPAKQGHSGKTAFLDAQELGLPEQTTTDFAGPGDSHSPARVSASRASSSSEVNAREVDHLQRRVDQLKMDLRMARGGGNKAQTHEQLEEDVDNLSRERDELKRRIQELESVITEDGANAKVQRASEITREAGDLVSSLNDTLSNLRINVMAAEGEFDQFANVVPRASFELIREALRTSATDMESAREMLRELRKLAGVS